jgi:peptidyl-tRNA hydrolase, PTH1 family
MKLIVGLGNPGRRYRDTRHNVGFAVVNLLADRHRAAFEGAPGDAVMARVRQLGDGGTLLLKPLTFMNLSGHAVSEVARYFRIELPDVLVVVDEISLPLGRLRARPRGSDGGHRGLRSIVGQFGSQEVPRLRVGVGRGDPRRDLADHVLAGFDAEERPIIASALERAADASELFVSDGIEAVMNRFNAAGEEEKESGSGL